MLSCLTLLTILRHATHLRTVSQLSSQSQISGFKTCSSDEGELVLSPTTSPCSKMLGHGFLCSYYDQSSRLIPECLTCRAMQAFEAYVKETEREQAVASQNFKAYHHKQRTASSSQGRRCNWKSRTSDEQNPHAPAQPDNPQRAQPMAVPANTCSEKPLAEHLQLTAALHTSGHHRQATQQRACPVGSTNSGREAQDQEASRSRPDHASQAESECISDQRQGSQIIAQRSDDDLASSLQDEALADKQSTGKHPRILPRTCTSPSSSPSCTLLPAPC